MFMSIVLLGSVIMKKEKKKGKEKKGGGGMGRIGISMSSKVLVYVDIGISNKRTD